MAVTTNLTNKPILPRGNDQSPKGYNRAALYSGKALSFDGVNDILDLSSTITLTDFSLCAYIDKSSVETAGIFSNSDGTDAIMFRSTSANDFRIRINSNNNNISLDDDGVYDDGLNFWVFIREDANFYIYKNGHKVAESSSVQTNDFEVSKIGAQGTTNFLESAVSGARVFNQVLTAAQVADLYNNPEKIVPTGVEDTALKLFLPMQEGAGTTCYNGAPDALGSNVVTNGTFDTDLTGWSTNDFSNGSIVQSSGTALITSNGGSGYPSIWQQVTTIVGERYIVKANFSNNTTGIWFWKFDDNSPLGSTNRVQFIDNDATASIDGVFEFTATSTLSSISAFAEQGNAGSFNFDNVEVLQISNIGTISGATWTHGIGAPVAQTSVIDWNKHTLDGTNEVLIPQGLTAGRDLIGNLFENVRKQAALNLDGNSWAEVHDNASLDVTDAISLECWVYWDTSFSTAKGLFGKWTSGSDCYLLYISDTTTIRFYINSSISTYGSLTNGWHHIVGTYDKTNRKLYVDGTLQDTDAMTADINTSALPVEIGRHTYSASKCVDNSIAQPRIYNRALTAEEVARNFAAHKSIYTNS